MKDPGARYNNLKKTVPIIFLLIILFFSAWVRFDGITEQGIAGGAAFYYISEAKLWAEGQPPRFMEKFYRPAVYFLQGIAVKIFGYNDYSVKILHGIMDMINILLIFLISVKMAGELWVGTMSSLVYAFLPAVINTPRSDLMHVESTTFVLLALFFFVLFDRREKKNNRFWRWFLLFLAGLNSGLAANTHPELAFLAPGYILYLLIRSYDSQNKKESIKEFIILAFIFTFAFFTPYLIGFLLFGIKTVINVFFRETSAAFSTNARFYHTSKPLIFLSILYYLVKYYFKEPFFITGLLLVGSIFIMIYRKMKKQSDPLWAYLPVILILSYALLFACFFNHLKPAARGRILIPLLPLVIFIIAQWYYKLFKQHFGKYSSIVFVCLFFMLFLVNPKEMPGKTKYKSQFRLVYDMLEERVNPGNKLLIAPVVFYSNDRGFQSDLYFEKNAVYMVDLPIKNKYSLTSLSELLAGKNIRFLFLGKQIDRRLLIPDFPLGDKFSRWLRNDKNPYSLEKDLEIIHSYIRGKGGFLINKNPFGEIYFLSGDKQEPGLIANGSFEHWLKGVPMGEWRLVKGRVSKSGEASEGSASIRFQPDDKEGSHIVWHFRDLFKDELKLRVRLEVKTGKLNRFIFFLTAGIAGKRQGIKPGTVKYNGKGGWVTMVKDFTITPDMKGLAFHLWLLPGAGEPAFVDNLSIKRSLK